MEPLKTPDVTLMQKLVGAISLLIGAILTTAQSFGADLSGEQITQILGLWTAFAGVLVIADAIIRNGRSRAMLNAPKGMADTKDEASA